MEFSQYNSAVAYDPETSEVHLGSSAEQILRLHRLLGEARLTWH
jgi:hypothetical protein